MKTNSWRIAVLTVALFFPRFASAEIVEVKAFKGLPLGVGSIELSLEKPLVYKSDQKNFELLEGKRRALHSVIAFQRDKETPNSNWSIRRRALEQQVTKCTVFFLFPGNDELELTLRLRDGRSFNVSISPSENAKRAELANEWWKHYEERSIQRSYTDGTGEAFEGYLSGMLARRMRINESSHTATLNNYSPMSATQEFLGTLIGTESIRAAMQKKRLLWKTRRNEKLTRILPTGLTIPEVPVPKFPDDVEIEPIAQHVPEDCFYIRCGSFKNFNWIRDNIDELGSRLRDLVQRTTVDKQIQDRLEKQLALKETALLRLLGGTVISDVALIGSDTFLSEGAGLGLIFEARQNSVLESQLMAQRKQAAQEAGIKPKTIVIASRDVDVLTNDDNSVRSFYVIDGDYHLVTNSQKLVEDFLQVPQGKDSWGKGKNSLASLKEFRHSRNLMPVKDKHTAFVYLSDPFFRRILSPAIRTEMTRRIQALAELEMVQFAQVAAKAEGRKGQTIDSLVAGGFLPKNFLTRPDGSHAKEVDGQIVDSLRGSKGAFIPVVDIKIDMITESELVAYSKFKTEYRRLWTRMDPVTVGITRKRVSKERDKLIFQFHITPYVKRGGLGLISSYLEPKNLVELQRSPGDLMGLEVCLNGMASGFVGGTKKTNMFMVMRDFDPEFTIERGEVKYTETKEQPPYYLGVTPILTIHNNQIGGRKIKQDKDGYFEGRSNGVIGMGGFGRIFDEFQVQSNQHAVLKTVTPNIKMLPSKRSAQLRAWMGDLKESKTYGMINTQIYLESRKSAAGAAGFLTFLSDQLQIKPKRANRVAELLLGGKLVCPLGGEFQTVGSRKTIREWRSTKCDTASSLDIKSIPKDYRCPLIEWVHGAELEFNINATTLETRVELDVSRAN